MREHGTNACYVWGPEPGAGKGCRCDPCQVAAKAVRDAAKLRTAPAYVDATRAREHVEWLGTHGVGLKAITRKTGVSGGTLCKLVYGQGGKPPSKRIKKATEDKLLAVTPADASDGARVDKAPMLADIATLTSRGWTKSAIARAIGVLETNLMPRGPQVSAGRTRAVHALLDEPVPAPRTRTGLGAKAAQAYDARTVEVEDPNDALAEVVAARREVEELPVIDPEVFEAEWRRRAACRIVPEAERWIFWPEPTDTQAIDAAKDVCSHCPVTADCLTYALEAGEQGVWGGTTDDERAYIIAVPDPDDRWIHERWTATFCDRVYPNGAWCDREPGHRGKHHTSAEQGGGRSPATLSRPIRHGTEGGYRTHRRRGEQACEDCQTANRLAQAARRDAA